jgi:hypothetical protein
VRAIWIKLSLLVEALVLGIGLLILSFVQACNTNPALLIDFKTATAKEPAGLWCFFYSRVLSGYRVGGSLQSDPENVFGTPRMGAVERNQLRFYLIARDGN